MKKRILLLFICFFLVSSLVKVKAANPQGNNNQVTTPIEYALPYPGILPDSPLYVLKVVRDRIFGWAIQNSLSKSFYLLLLSDKRLSAGQVLINTGKIKLGAETIVKGEDYFTEAINGAEMAKNKKDNIGELMAKLTVAGMKHEEIIKEMQGKTSGDDLTQLTKAYEENQKSRSRVREMVGAR